MTKIKICGISRKEDTSMLNEVMPDYAGLVFAQSKRQVDIKTAKYLKIYLDKKIKTIGIFVNENPKIINKLVSEKIIDIVQLHGDEDENYIKSLKEMVTCPIIKALRVQNSKQILNFQSMPCDYLLLDTFNDKTYGGSGQSFDWSIIPTAIKPYFLAGGLNFDNISKAIKLLNPYCVDVSSSVETYGLKDRDKILNFVNKVRSCKI